MVGIASLGGLLFGYETGVTAGALERGESSWLSTATLIGAMIGALAAGRIADLVGRRDVIMATGALFTLGAFVSAIAPSELVNLIEDWSSEAAWGPYRSRPRCISPRSRPLPAAGR